MTGSYILYIGSESRTKPVTSANYCNSYPCQPASLPSPSGAQ